MKLYHWTWDAIGGGTGFWYIPVWWMGSAFLAWLGAMVTAYRARSNANASAMSGAMQSIVLAMVLFIALTGTGVAPFHSAVAALAYGMAMVIHVPIAAALNRR